jgi:thioesterase domain-containing protein
MNLCRLAAKAAGGRPFLAVQAHGLNAGETPYATIAEMAARDAELIRAAQPEGPYTLWGYSFGARLAFETAWQLEQAGARVERLLLIAPGSPRLADDGSAARRILYSVFAAALSGPGLDDVLRAPDEDALVAALAGRFKALDAGLVRRIVRLVGLTYEFKYTFAELARRTIQAPVTIVKARGDDYSFIEGSGGYAAAAPTVVELDTDHYGILKEPGVDRLAAALDRRP